MSELDTRSPIKIFRLDEYEWWVGESLIACITEARKQCGADTYPEAETEGLEVSPEGMLKLTFIDEGDDESRTFAEQLEREIAEGGEFPRPFAFTEW